MYGGCDDELLGDGDVDLPGDGDGFLPGECDDDLPGDGDGGSGVCSKQLARSHSLLRHHKHQL